jgi:hypothetical protein
MQDCRNAASSVLSALPAGQAMKRSSAGRTAAVGEGVRRHGVQSCACCGALNDPEQRCIPQQLWYQDEQR